MQKLNYFAYKSSAAVALFVGNAMLSFMLIMQTSPPFHLFVSSIFIKNLSITLHNSGLKKQQPALSELINIPPYTNNCNTSET